MHCNYFRGVNLRVILGAGQTRYDGWISTQENELNLLSIDDWNRLF